MSLDRIDRQILGDFADEVALQRRAAWQFVQWMRAEVDCCDAAAEEAAGALLFAFNAWCDAAGVPRSGVTRLGRFMTECGIGRRKGPAGRIIRVGCRLRQAPPVVQSPEDALFERWLAECCDVGDPAARVNATVLFQQFEQFALNKMENGAGRMTQTAFGRRLSRRGISAMRVGAVGRVDRVGIRLKHTLANGRRSMLAGA